MAKQGPEQYIVGVFPGTVLRLHTSPRGAAPNPVHIIPHKLYLPPSLLPSPSAICHPVVHQQQWKMRGKSSPLVWLSPSVSSPDWALCPLNTSHASTVPCCRISVLICKALDMCGGAGAVAQRVNSTSCNVGIPHWNQFKSQTPQLVFSSLPMLQENRR